MSTAPVAESDRWGEDLDLAPRVVEELCAAYAPLARWLAERRGARGGPLVVGVAGAPGSGKTTLRALVTRLLEAHHDLGSAGFSLDDLYLTRAEREALSKAVHPLLKTRGVPGTHDVRLGHETLDVLTSGPRRSVLVPAFDKAADDRLPPDRWPSVTAPVDLVIFEGWCVGAAPEPDERLIEPLNDLERDEDPDGIWRTYVNEKLRGPYAALFERLDVLVLLQVPNLACVRRWRAEQEEALRRQLARQGRPDTTMDDAAIDRFIALFERVTSSMLREMPSRADAVLTLDEAHQIAAMRIGDREIDLCSL